MHTCTVFLKSTVIFKNLSMKFKTKLKYEAIKTQQYHKHNLKGYIYICIDVSKQKVWI